MSANISIFVPHNGCRNQCSFCNQFCITSQHYQPTGEDVDNAVNIALNHLGKRAKEAEIAFFGGSFTAIEREYMLSLLKSAHKYVINGSVGGIRISTRPDAISREILDILKSFGVTTIELGAQSMCDDVLLENHRGHSAECVVKSSKLIKEYGFRLGLQMMTGLYCDNDEKAIKTCKKIIALKPDCVRIYPTIVLKNTMLEKLLSEGKYHPQSLDDAVELCCTLLDMFDVANIPVIRLGLHTIDNDAYVAGPWHSAFGELCESLRLYRRFKVQICKQGSYEIAVSPKMVSKAIGHNRSNIKRFAETGILVKIIEDSNLNDGSFTVREVKQ